MYLSDCTAFMRTVCRHYTAFMYTACRHYILFVNTRARGCVSEQHTLCIIQSIKLNNRQPMRYIFLVFPVEGLVLGNDLLRVK